MTSHSKADVAIIGGGYYGCVAAIDIKAARPDLDVVVVERAKDLFAEASSTNQGQLHAGYMYSKFPDLARECAESAHLFQERWGEAVNNQVQTLYGIHRDSDISPQAYERFCGEVGLYLRPAVDVLTGLRGGTLLALYDTDEKTFDNPRLQQLIRDKLRASAVRLSTDSEVTSITADPKAMTLGMADGRQIVARTVFNACFSDSNALHERAKLPKLPLEHAVFLHFLIRLPQDYRNAGLIVVRGMYAALSPLNNERATHTFASGTQRVIHSGKIDAPSQQITPEEVKERYRLAIAEALPYVPILAEAENVGHVIGTRTNYVDPTTQVAASRAMVLEHYAGRQNYHIIFGGKVTCLPEITNRVQKIAKEL